MIHTLKALGGMAVAPHHLAAQAARDVLRDGGNAVEAMVAAGIVGAAVVPIDPRTKGDKLHFMLSNSQCSAAIAADYVLPRLQPLRERLPGLRWERYELDARPVRALSFQEVHQRHKG